MDTQDIVREILEEFGVSVADLDAPLLKLFGDEFSSLWGEVSAEIEERTGIVLTADDIPLGMKLNELIAKVDQKRRILV